MKEETKQWIREFALERYPESRVPPFKSVKAFDLNSKHRQILIESLIVAHEKLSPTIPTKEEIEAKAHQVHSKTLYFKDKVTSSLIEMAEWALNFKREKV